MRYTCGMCIHTRVFLYIYICIYGIRKTVKAFFFLFDAERSYRPPGVNVRGEKKKEITFNLIPHRITCFLYTFFVVLLFSFFPYFPCIQVILSHRRSPRLPVKYIWQALEVHCCRVGITYGFALSGNPFYKIDEKTSTDL